MNRLTKSIVNWLLVIAIVAVNVGQVSAQTPDATPEPWFTPTFTETEECAYPLPPGLDTDWSVYCGYVTVPLYYDGRSDETIRLPIVVLPSTTSHPDSIPLVVLNGGPGQSLDSSLPLFGGMLPFLSFMREGQDMIFYDQRGMGMSEPSLACPWETQTTATLPSPVPNATPAATPLVADDTLQDKLISCKDDLEARGIDLSAFNTRASAADLNSIRIALGAEQLDLYGVSYGSRLALTAMRDYPEAIHSAILASTLPLEANPIVDQVVGFDAALRELFDQCAADENCGPGHPDLEQQFLDVIADLQANPRMVATQDLLTGAESEVLLDARTFLEVIYLSVFSGLLLADIPDMIAQTAAGNDELIAMFAPLVTSVGGVTLGAMMAVNCQDEYAFTSPEQIAQDIAEHDVYAPLADGTFRGINWYLEDACAAWDLPADDPQGNAPVTSDVPTLIISGAFDPVTPPQNAAMVDEQFANATVLTLGTAGHDPASLGGDCAWDAMSAFLGDPAATIDTTCGAADLDFSFTLGDAVNGAPLPGDATPMASPQASPAP